MPQIFERKNGEILVNTDTVGTQNAGAIAVLSTGGYVVVWTTEPSPDIETADVHGQRFDANGNKVGGEFLVNTATTSFQGQAKVAALDNGRFVVTWSNLDNVTSGDDQPDSGIKGQIYNADGTRSGGEFFVNTTQTGLQLAPALKALTGGGFVITWTDGSQTGGDTSSNAIKAQLFDSAGAKVGGEFLVNTVTTGSQSSPALTALASGGFAAVWRGPSVIKLQLFDSAGTKVGAEQQVNTSALSAALTPGITQLSGGRIVVTWSHSEGAGDTTGFDLSAQLFDSATGAKIGAEFQVNTVTAGDQQIAEGITALPDGSFLITWQGPGASGTGLDIHGQVFDSNGAMVGTEFIVNATTAGDQNGPRVVVLANGDVVALWNDGSGTGGDTDFSVKIQVLTIATGGPTDITLSNTNVSETEVDNLPVATLGASGGSLNSSFTYTIVSDPSGAFGIDGDKLIVADNRLLDFETQPSVDVRIRATDLNGHSFEETMTLTITDAVNETHWSAGEIFSPITNTLGFNSPAAVTALASGGFVIINSWFEIGVGSGLRGQIFDSDGDRTGTEFNINLANYRSGGAVSAAALPGGGFALAYEGHTVPVGNGFPVRLQLFDANGQAVGGDVEVSTDNAGILQGPSVAMLDSGNFVVSWTRDKDEAGAPSGSQIHAQLLDSSGNKIGGEFRVNTGIAGGQTHSHVAALPTGGFVVTWDDSDSNSIEAQRFDAAGNKVGGELMLFTTTGQINQSQLAVLESGGFVVTWLEVSALDELAVRAQIVGADGVSLGGPVLIASPVTDGFGIGEHVAALPGGGFVVSWTDATPSPDDNPDDTQSWARFFTATGAPAGDAFLITDSGGESQRIALIAMLASGDLVFTWDYAFVLNNTTTSDMAARILTLVDNSGAIVGTPGPDVLTGTGGDDQILGLGGDDYLIGGGGNDDMRGGPGNDTYYVDSAGDIVSEAAGEGFDIVYASASYQLTAGSEIEILSTSSQSGTDPLVLVGNALNQQIYGNAGANFLQGGGGIDYLIGLGGNDVYFVAGPGDNVVESAGGGSRDIIYTPLDYTLVGGVEIEVLSSSNQAGTNAQNLVGNEFGQEIIGNAGSNFLQGGGGTDYLIGLGGNDTYFVAGPGDNVVESAGGGNDIIYTPLNYVMIGGVEVELLASSNQSGTGAQSLMGNAFNQTIYGNNGANFIEGGGGTDVLVGLGGNDTYVVDSAGDYVAENTGGGSDVVYAQASYALAAGQEIEVLSTSSQSSTAAINLSGNELANQLYGNAGANVLNGGAGADYMLGFGGTDTFQFTTALGGGNVDQLADFFHADDTIELDHGVFTGLGVGPLAGSAFVAGSAAGDGDDRIIYNSATGQLFFDADGSGAGAAAILFATVQPGTVLDASDFTVI